ncbi:branched-chain amino acid aminotransferase [Kibdelosporangium philippinense]|uniref:Branched-chain-amino-acid aminotransferase n=1 Tax=Kibdelosporangium philippinense TaxID=211113 RepID=A0ABS8Z7Y7_9PSEU|nr:branched-chain amino acid aminotransferase [Kibdelosporangium philippinense]MCE7001947.1 branched-chain amino acid aminotransferase [Kibdelosporangium philippinense]
MTIAHTSSELSPELLNRLDAIELTDPLGFSKVMAPVMAVAYYRDGAWETPRLTGLEPMDLWPHTQALHYGQALFEGMKAYRNLGDAVPGASALLFRPFEHARRMNRTALRLGMPELPEQVYVETLERLVSAVDKLVPNRQGQSLYLRPTMFGATADLSVVPSTEFCFVVLATPSDAFFTAPISAWIERLFSRAGPGGTGNVKAAGNYAASFAAAAKLGEKGFHQLLWLDAATHTQLEEFTAMNVFVRRGDRLLTPPLSDTILAGITRDSLLRLGPTLGLDMREEPVAVDEVIDAVRSGEEVELFGCGTGAVVAPVELLGDDSGLRLPLPGREVASRLRQHMLDLQHGLIPGPEGWQWPVPKS